jgi:hypothetical protein
MLVLVLHLFLLFMVKMVQIGEDDGGRDAVVDSIGTYDVWF